MAELGRDAQTNKDVLPGILDSGRYQNGHFEDEDDGRWLSGCSRRARDEREETFDSGNSDRENSAKGKC